jgi:L-alanine-DL-glutamate epimerase-like enolase superfamily enzyme
VVGVTPQLGPGALAETLARLEVRVATAEVERSAVPLADYPGGPRPSSVVRLSGEGALGFGENVAFDESEHERFAAYVSGWARRNAGARLLHVGSAVPSQGTPYERAALEAALIDLALCQARLSLRALTGVETARLRFVASLAASPEPSAVVRDLRRRGFTGDLKIDVDPGWSPAILAAIAGDPRIAIFDFKGRGHAALAAALYASSAALLEDPPLDFHAPPRGRARISRDGNVSDAPSVAALSARGESVNLKAPRMGGPLEVLRGLELAPSARESEAPDPPIAYLGGMFEVGVGRTQARMLAALYCPDGPNDLALNGVEPRANPPALIRLDQPGFGRT